jgi:predicted dehydrogenase
VSTLGVGVVGCGTISHAYLRNGDRLEGFRFVCCADAFPEAAEKVAEQYGLEAVTTEGLLARDDVDVVLCLTPPDHHADVALQAIGAGKHFHTEKPLATNIEDARRVLEAAEAAGVLVGCAPDTFLGPGVETLRKALLDGVIGTPSVAVARMLAGPPENWHESPAFLYADLAGPLLDIGPYAVATAAQLFGPVRRVAALASRPREQGTIAKGPNAGTSFPIAEPTRVNGVLEHDGGVLTTLIATFDADGAAQHGIEIHGSEGTLLGGDMNTFHGPVILRRRGEQDEELELLPGFTDNARGLGLQDLCRAVSEGTEQRASGALGLMVVEVLLGVRRAAAEGRAVEIHGTAATSRTS